jgi:methionine-rich copper-binding protein CopC
MTSRDRVAATALGTALWGAALPGLAWADHPGLGSEAPLALLGFAVAGLWLVMALGASFFRERRRRARRKAGRPSRWTLPILLALVVLSPAVAAPHAYLVKSAPARRAILLRAPARVQLWFNERLEARFSRLSVWNREGQQVDLGDVQVGPEDPTRLSVGVPPLAPGTYTIRFRVLSVDGHVVEDQFPFILRGGE